MDIDPPEVPKNEEGDKPLTTTEPRKRVAEKDCHLPKKIKTEMDGSPV